MTLLFFGRPKSARASKPEELAIVKLFFDSFSQRVSSVEQEMRSVASELRALKGSRDKSEISDLVLLERLQRAEGVLTESLDWIKRIADVVRVTGEAEGKGLGVRQSPGSLPTVAIRAESVLPKFVMLGGESGSLSSITTPTELQVLGLLVEQGPKSAPEIGRVIGRSREHSARLMKKLFEEGYVKREQTRIPFRYSVVERVRASFVKSEEKRAETREEAAAVQG